jgi:F0F1-type ATP synthase delta subunit
MKALNFEEELTHREDKMTVNAYARRYSQAIFRMALQEKDLNRWQSDLRKVATLTERQRPGISDFQSQGYR